MLQQGLERLPDVASLHHALGLLRARQERLPAAVESLGRAARQRFLLVDPKAWRGRRRGKIPVLAAGQDGTHIPHTAFLLPGRIVGIGDAVEHRAQQLGWQGTDRFNQPLT